MPSNDLFTSDGASLSDLSNKMPFLQSSVHDQNNGFVKPRKGKASGGTGNGRKAEATHQERAEEDEGDEVGVGQGGAASLALVLNNLDAQSLVERHLVVVCEQIYCIGDQRRIFVMF